MKQIISRRGVTGLRQATNTLLLDTCTLRNTDTETIGAGGGVVKGTPIETVGVRCLRLIDAGLFRGSGISEVVARLQLTTPYYFQFDFNQTNLKEGTTVLHQSESFMVRAVVNAGALGMNKIAVCARIG